MTKQVAIITGAGRGIGRAVAEHLALGGWTLALVARTSSELATVASQITAAGGSASAHALDVADAGAVQMLTAQVVAQHGRIDALINIAGQLGPFGRFGDLELAELHPMVASILWGTLNTCHAVLPHMETQGGGTIVNIAGYGAADPSPRLAVYGAVKAAIVRFSESLALEYKRAKIRVHAFGPGLVTTRLSTEIASTPEGQRYADGMVRLAQTKGVAPQEAAALVAWLLSADSAPLTGRLITVHDDYLALGPQAAQINAGNAYTLRRVQE